uniref:Uncharacterized protein n=1 Tax=Anguilla anguilla TaxID=7936 RepID=A0A0E9PEN2_ANGAN
MRRETGQREEGWHGESRTVPVQKHTQHTEGIQRG